MSFTAHLRDMMFNLQHLAGLDNGAQQIFGFEDGVEIAQEQCVKLNDGVIAPLNFDGDENPSWFKNAQVTSPGFKDAFKQFTKGGWQGLSIRSTSAAKACPRQSARRRWR